MDVVSFANESTGEGRGIRVHLPKIGLHAAKINGAYLAVFGAHGVLLHPASLQESGHALNRRASIEQGLLVFQGQGLAQAFFERAIASMKALIPLGDEGGVGSKLVNLVLNGLIKPID